MMTHRTIIATAILSVLAMPSAGANTEQGNTFEQISIIGSENNVNDIPGSGAYLGTKMIEEFEYTDIMRILSNVPGVYVMEEDGYGLRPNIGMRGASINRSDKITLMEDGVLAAPAAYAAPSAYYFPTFGRMSAVEVLKGSSGVQYGPRTAGGVINLVSSQIPNKPLAGDLDISLGEDQYRKIHGVVGGQQGDYAGLLEVFRYEAEGFKSLPVNRDTGFDKNDYMGKFRVTLGERDNHRLELKYKYSDETSDESYLGLTDDDFKRTPYRRYAASQLDQMDTDHNSVQLNYAYDLSENSEINVTVYQNDFHRNWYKASKVGGKSLGSGAEQMASAFDADPIGGLAVDVKANNRDYLSKGVQTQLLSQWQEHQLTFGVRIHEDEMDRYQWVDKYTLNNDLTMTLDAAGVHGTDSNRVDSADAVALYVHDEYTLDQWVISGGLRYEDIDIERDDWGKSDPARANAASHKQNAHSVLIPAIGFTYAVNDQWLLLGGVQKVFDPAAPGNEQAAEEEAWNYELGTRFNYNGFSGEVIAFYADYENMHGNCTASQGCSDENNGNQYNAGQIEIQGLEVKLDYQYQLGQFNVPIGLVYTLTDGEFKTSFSSDLESWGNVEAGDELPYVPEQQLQLKVGINNDDWDLTLAGRYVDEVRVKAGSGAILAQDRIAGRTVWDLAAKYNINPDQRVYLTVDNLFDKEYAATRANGGLTPGKYRTVQVGYSYHF